MDSTGRSEGVPAEDRRDDYFLFENEQEQVRVAWTSRPQRPNRHEDHRSHSEGIRREGRAG